jgi:hypothetical protein
MKEIELIHKNPNVDHKKLDDKNNNISSKNVSDSFTYDASNSWTVVTTIDDLSTVGYLTNFKTK